MNETTSLRWRSHAAKAAINYNTIDNSDYNEAEKEDDKKLVSRGRLCCGARIIDGVAATAVASSMATWIVSNNALIKTSSAMTFLFGPFVACQQRKLQRLGNLRRHNNQVREEVNYLRQEQERLQRSLLRLDGNVIQMEKMEREMNRIAGSPHNVNRMLEVITEQKEVNEAIKENLRKSVLQNILKAVVLSDQDKDFQIHSREMELLVVRLSMMDGVTFHEDKFRQLMGNSDGSQPLSYVMRLIRSLLQDEEVFVLSPEDLISKR